MKKFLFLIAIFCASKTNAQTYLITFAGTGESTTVNTVKVENLTAGTSLTLNGSDILRLNIVTGVNSIEDNQSSELKIYPNPMTDNATMQIFPPVAGDAIITVCDITGKQVAQIQSYLENLSQGFRLSGLKNGFYLINVKGKGYQFSGKLVSNGKSNGTIRIEKVKSITEAINEKASKTDSKGVQETVDMAYTTGDRIKFTGISGIYSTVKTDIPEGDKTITFNFIACTDSDNNNYPVVEIGYQVWMAENLKTTKYRNGDLIGTTTPATLDISGESTPKYQWAVDGNESNVATYGRLYTWYAVADPRYVCPNDWHVPTNNDWKTLTDYLTNNGYGYGGIANHIGKSMAATSGWTTSSSTGSVGNDQASNNSSGFTALPISGRGSNGTFYANGSYGELWYGTENNEAVAWTLFIEYWYDGVSRLSNNKNAGLGVRCLQGEGFVPTLTTTAVSIITTTTTRSGGNISTDGGATVTAYGVCWSTSSNPTTADSKTTDGSGTGTFTSSITGLIPYTTYYTRAYATNSIGTAYGNEISFTTNPVVAITTNNASSITQTTAISGGNITSDGGATVIAYGVCWSTSANPTVADSKTTDGSGTGTFTSSITGLTANTTYYIRAYATYSIGTAYGNEENFTTNPTVAVINTTAASSITTTTATSGGYILNDGGAPVTTYGVCWNTSPNPTTADSKTTDGSGTGTFISSITGLTQYTTYYTRAYATNSVGTAYGNEISFTTNPTITTNAVSLITQTTATSGGNIISDGGVIITARGVCWSTTTNPTIADNHTTDGTGIGDFSSNLTGLTLNTRYCVRAYVTNSEGTTYGNEKKFATRGETGTVSDIDGNTYSTIEIGPQTWMAENLKTTKYSNGDLIGTTIPADLDIRTESTPKYQWAFEGYEGNVDSYGRLYTWYTVTDTRNLCPTGWHVSTDAEWHALVLYLDANAILSSPESSIVGGKLKETGIIHWSTPNQGATNETGFTARAGGFRASTGVYLFQKMDGYWWSSTESSTTEAWSRWISSAGPSMYSLGLIDRQNADKKYGMPLRCVRD